MASKVKRCGFWKVDADLYRQGGWGRKTACEAFGMRGERLTLKRALYGVPEVIMPEPPGLITVRIDRDTGLVTDADNPHALFEIFRSDRIPRRHAGLPTVRSTTPTETAASVPEQLF